MIVKGLAKPLKEEGGAGKSDYKGLSRSGTATTWAYTERGAKKGPEGRREKKEGAEMHVQERLKVRRIRILIRRDKNASATRSSKGSGPRRILRNSNESRKVKKSERRAGRHQRGRKVRTPGAREKREKAEDRRSQILLIMSLIERFYTMNRIRGEGSWFEKDLDKSWGNMEN